MPTSKETRGCGSRALIAAPCRRAGLGRGRRRLDGLQTASSRMAQVGRAHDQSGREMAHAGFEVITTDLLSAWKGPGGGFRPRHGLVDLGVAHHQGGEKRTTSSPAPTTSRCWSRIAATIAASGQRRRPSISLAAHLLEDLRMRSTTAAASFCFSFRPASRTPFSEEAGFQHHVEHGVAGSHGEQAAAVGRTVGAESHAGRRRLGRRGERRAKPPPMPIAGRENVRRVRRPDRGWPVRPMPHWTRRRRATAILVADAAQEGETGGTGRHPPALDPARSRYRRSPARSRRAPSPRRSRRRRCRSPHDLGTEALD